ncbi:hypothetical protein D3C87_1330420 [compost metagenome]
MELHAVDAVADVRHLRGRRADGIHQPVAQVGADGNEVLHQRQHQFAQQPVFAAGAVQVAHVAPVFAMHAQAHAGQAGQQLRLEAAQVARVHHCRPQLFQHAVQVQVVAPVLAFALVQADHIDTGRGQAQAKRGGVLHADDGVPVAFRRQMVDQVDEAVFQPAHVELVDHVDDQGGDAGRFRVAGIEVKGHAAAPASVVR